MFSKLLDIIVDGMILKKTPLQKRSAQINYNNPLIHSDRPRKTHAEYAQHMKRKIAKSHALPKMLAPAMSSVSSIPKVIEKSTRAKILLLLLFSTSISFIFFKHQFFILIFIMIGAISRLTQKYFPLIIGLDFCLFFSILVTIAYSPILGLLTGIISSTIGSFLRQIERAEYYFTPIYGFIPVWIFMSLSFIPQMNIVLTGMICVVVYIIARFIAISIIYPLCIMSQFTYISSTLLFNYFLFANFANILIYLMV